jgi:ATP-dependent DNA helicase DinG
LDQCDVLRTNDVFDLLAKNLPNYECREQQRELALSIEYAFNAGKTGIFEAGTGTGKSLAALIPAVLARKKVVVSTNTISLQEQYIHKDIPSLQKALPFPIDAALLKGRGNYIGLRRWEEALVEQEIDHRIIDWVQNSEKGDISELEFVPPFDVWQEINSDTDDCLRNKCPQFNQCFYFEAKRRAEKADIIVVNHALLLTDAAAGGGIIPAYDLLIVDEAHHLPDVATDIFSSSVSNRSIRNLANKALKKVMAPPGLIHDMEERANEFFRELAMRYPALKTRLKEPVERARDLAASLFLLRSWLEQQTFDHLLDYDQARDKAKLKARALITSIDHYLACLDLVADPQADWVIWVARKDQIGTRMEVVAAPLDVAEFIQSAIFDKPGLESSIWMSATLASVGEDPFQYFKRTVGIGQGVVQAQVRSPFDYTRQSLLYLPNSLPDPNQKEYISKAADEIARIIEFSQGRAFVLFTSHAALAATYDLLYESLPYECKKQGDAPRQKLIDWFLATPNAVLFGTASFWEGVSIDGEQLSCVIIDRIPFQSPDDPIYEARCDRLKESEEASWFNDLALPHATMRLKQGVGRLIRTNTDRGIVAILDPRLTRKQYGKHILACLPPMRVVSNLREHGSLEEVFAKTAPKSSIEIS